MIEKDKNMTLDDLRKLPRISRGKGTSLLGVLIDAWESGDDDLARMAASVMAEQNEGLGIKDNRGVPMCDGTPGHARECLRRIDLREKNNG